MYRVPPQTPSENYSKVSRNSMFLEFVDISSRNDRRFRFIERRNSSNSRFFFQRFLGSHSEHRECTSECIIVIWCIYLHGGLTGGWTWEFDREISDPSSSDSTDTLEIIQNEAKLSIVQNHSRESLVVPFHGILLCPGMGV